jgi:hypothetical protein
MEEAPKRGFFLSLGALRSRSLAPHGQIRKLGAGYDGYPPRRSSVEKAIFGERALGRNWRVDRCEALDSA